MGAMQPLPGLRYTCSINEKSPGARGTAYLFLASLALVVVLGIKVSSTMFDLIYSTFTVPWCLYSTLMHFIQHCFICRSSDSTVSEDAGIESRTVTTSAVAVTLIKKKSKFSSLKGKFREIRMEQLQSHIWLTASSYMGKYLRISLYIRKPLLIYNFATAPLWISLYMRKILFSFLSVQSP